MNKKANEIVDKIIRLIEQLNDCSDSNEFAQAKEYICDELNEYE